MFFDAGLKTENHIYLIEHFSRSLISIHIPSGKARVEVYLPWKYMEQKLGMLFLEHNVFIYSPIMNHFLAYDCLEQKIKVIRLQEIEARDYHSNVLMHRGEFIVLPFKGKTIKRYGINGELKFKDEKWCSAIAEECGCSENQFNNIRMDSACIIENKLFFSLSYGNQNYLCRYELNKEEHLCKIVFCSKDIAIRGVYAYSNIVLFRRIFSNKTEVILINLDTNEQKTIRIDFPSIFEEDVYGEIDSLKAPFKDRILKLKENGSNLYKKIYDFEQSDVYIANGILFNMLKNEILVPEEGSIKKYSLEDIIKEIKNCSFYQEAYRELLSEKYTYQRNYKLQDFLGKLMEFSSKKIENCNSINSGSTGKLIWKRLF